MAEPAARLLGLHHVQLAMPPGEEEDAVKFYGDASKWKKIHAANADKIPNPDLIHPGLELTIPDA